MGTKMINKLEIITFHRALSYGASFQTYALQEYIKFLSNADVEIIDYIPKRFTTPYLILHQPSVSSLFKRLIRLIPFFLCKSTEVLLRNRFNRKYLNLTKKVFKSEDELSTYNFNSNFFITGSDQVWNLSLDELDYIKPYFLSFTKDKDIRISYSASFGSSKLANISTSDNIIKDLLNRYHKISVREDSSVDLLKNIGINSIQVLDPTFLLTKFDWGKLAGKRKIKNNYIFIYGLYRNKCLYKLAHKIAQKRNLKIVNLANSYDFCKGAKNKIVVSHEDLLNYISNADYVITDSFHGAALSLNMNRQLFLFPSPRSNERIKSLVRLFNIEYRFIEDYKLLNEVNNWEVEMDYAKINSILEKERQKARFFLQETISSEELS